MNYLNGHLRTVGKTASTALLLVSLIGCATTSSSTSHNGKYRSAVDTTVQSCVASIGFGAVLGAFMGNSGRGKGDRVKSRQEGALRGAALGSLACAYFVGRATKRDKDRIREHEKAALNKQVAGVSTTSFVSDSGEQVLVETTTKDVPIPKEYTKRPSPSAAAGKTLDSLQSEKVYTVCRATNTTVGVANEHHNIGGGYVCRTPSGDWETITA